MATRAVQRLRQEVDLMNRFTQSYRRKFAVLIDRLNGSDADPRSDLQCVRLCIEAVDMMLASQSQVAQSLREMTNEPVAPVVTTERRAA
jgi:hypothetical protein